MAKKQYTGNITFDASAKSIVFDGNIQRDRFLLITNVTDNVIIYNFADSDLRMTSHSYSSTTDKTTIVLNHDTTSMSDADTLQVFFEDAEGKAWLYLSWVRGKEGKQLPIKGAVACRVKGHKRFGRPFVWVSDETGLEEVYYRDEKKTGRE